MRWGHLLISVQPPAGIRQGLPADDSLATSERSYVCPWHAIRVTFLLPTATSADERARAARTAILPVGSFEQHGEYLPLITDTVVACLVAGRIAADYSGLLLPPNHDLVLA